MYGETHDYHYPNSTSIYDRNAAQCGYILQADMVFLTIYYVFGRVCKLLTPPSKEALERFDDTGLKCRFKILTWREYENLQ
jgi:hypothetical protein